MEAARDVTITGGLGSEFAHAVTNVSTSLTDRPNPLSPAEPYNAGSRCGVLWVTVSSASVEEQRER